MPRSDSPALALALAAPHRTAPHRTAPHRAAAGLVGILLCLAGADVTLTDQPHITPLARLNALVGRWMGGWWLRRIGARCV